MSARPSARPCQRVLLLGATGMVGHRVARLLRARGFEVRTLVRDPECKRAVELAAAGCDVRRGDLRRRWTVWDALEGCDAVVSCAHIRFGGILTQACKTFGVSRLVVFSSTWRLSRFQSTALRSWWRGEDAVKSSGLDWTVLRATMTYDGREDRTVARIAAWMRLVPFFALPGGGRCRIAPLHADDAAEGAVAALAHPDATIRREIVLAGSEVLTYAEMVRRIARARRRRVLILPVPVPVVLLAMRLTGPLAGWLRVDPLSVRRFAEDRAFDSSDTAALLGRPPSAFRYR